MPQNLLIATFVSGEVVGLTIDYFSAHFKVEQTTDLASKREPLDTLEPNTWKRRKRNLILNNGVFQFLLLLLSILHLL